MEVEHHPVVAQRVARRSGDLVDSNFAVGVFDSVLDGANVNVGYRGPVAKVHCYTGGGAKALQKGNTIVLATLQEFLKLFWKMITFNTVGMWFVYTTVQNRASKYSSTRWQEIGKKRFRESCRKRSSYVFLQFLRVSVLCSTKRALSYI